jgi:hypothetical protein
MGSWEMKLIAWEKGKRLWHTFSPSRPCAFFTGGILLCSIAGLLVGAWLFQKGADAARDYEGAEFTKPICGISAVATICSLRGRPVDMGTVVCHTGLEDRGISLRGCLTALNDLGVSSLAVRFRSVADLPERVPCLCVVRTMKGTGRHAIVVIRSADTFLIIDGPQSRETDRRYLESVSEHLALVPR